MNCIKGQAAVASGEVLGADVSFQRLFAAAGEVGDAVVPAHPVGEIRVDEELQRQFEQADVYKPVAEKPSVALFKSIFLDESDSESDSELELDTNREKSDVVTETTVAIPITLPAPQHPQTQPQDAEFRLRISPANRKVEELESAPVKPVGKVSFVSRKDRLQNSLQNTISSNTNTISTASRRPKKAVLVGSLGDVGNNVDVEVVPVHQGVDVGVPGIDVVVQDPRGNFDQEELEEIDTKKRRKFQLNSKRKTTTTLSFDDGNDNDDAKKNEVEDEEIYNPRKKSSMVLQSAVQTSKHEVPTVTQKQLNESESDIFLASIILGPHSIVQKTHHADNIPLPSFFTTTPPSPITDKKSKPYSHSTNFPASLNISHKSQIYPNKKPTDSQRAVRTDPIVSSESDKEFDESDVHRNNNKSSLERLKSELNQSSRDNNSSSAKKKHKKKDKVRKKEKEKRKKSSKKGRIRDAGTSSSSESD